MSSKGRERMEDGMTLDYVKRVQYGAGLLILIAFFGVIRVSYLEVRAKTLRTPETFQVQSYIERYAGLTKLLPAHGIVGYLSDDPGNALTSASDARRFFLTQYALAPLIVVRDSNQALVICNVQDPTGVSRACEKSGLLLVHDLGNGVALLRRDKK
jgi:hypothetical protein